MSDPKVELRLPAEALEEIQAKVQEAIGHPPEGGFVGLGFDQKSFSSVLDDLLARVLEALQDVDAEVILRTGCWRQNNTVMCNGSAQRVVLGTSDGFDEAVCELLETAYQARHSDALRALGDGWGYSEAGHTDGAIAHMVRACGGPIEVFEIDGAHLCRFGAGTTIAALDEALASQVPPLALKNAPGFEELTFAGVMSVGGQGSGLSLGPLESQVRALELQGMAQDGSFRTVRLHESSPDQLPPLPPGVVDQRSPELFRAARCSLGGLGIIRHITIEVVPAYNLEEVRRSLSRDALWEGWETLLERQRAPRGTAGALHSAEVWLNPYADASDARGALLGTRAWTNEAPRGQRNRALRSGGRAMFLGLGYLMNLVPYAVPFILERALAAAEKADSIVLPSREALRFGSANKAPVTPTAFSVPLEETPRVVKDLCKRLDKRRNKGWVTSPIGIRFCQASEAYLAPANGRETCLIEIPILYGTDRAKETIEWVYEKDASYRPHWGQTVPLSPEELKQRFDPVSVDGFRRAAAELDPRGLFRSAWFEALLS